eukprot:TRINITY_DN93_c0_g2_i1.p1 TRINITY_DN93_c0_g2~~TRINITY_DN93_c0_g2_i1.p1  ORF type:complete len:524 (-),score=122.07 TRINITY_DN93_c0_g2_i1:672-2243(-)
MQRQGNTGNYLFDVFRLNVISDLRTGNPIIDIMLAGAIISLLNYIVSHKEWFISLIKKLKDWLFNKSDDFELQFTGEEYVTRWGNNVRNYPVSVRAILHYIDVNGCGVKQFKELKDNKARWGDDDDKEKVRLHYAINTTVEFPLEDGILCKCQLDRSDNNDEKAARTRIEESTYTIYSPTKTANELKTFMEKIFSDYQKFIKEEIDKNQYYFITKMEKIDDKRTLRYDQYKFSTNRTFSNIFFPERDGLVDRLNFFLENEQWYADRGIPHTLGFMFYGPPGTGKTSTIKAIASYTNRHIVEVSLGRIKTYKDLQQVFHDSNICDMFIPHHKIIYILEDIDCISDIVQQRKTVPKSLRASQQVISKEVKKDEEESSNEDDEEKKSVIPEDKEQDFKTYKEWLKMIQEDPLTLSHILNIIDGILETPGRILIITTNHPEKLDSALVRPGRIDMSVEFGYANAANSIEMLEMFFEDKVPEALVRKIPSGVFTPAEVFQVCFKAGNIEDSAALLCSGMSIHDINKYG